MLDTAIARPFPTARCVHAGLGRPHSRGGANGRHQGKGFRRGRRSAISLPLSGDIRERCPLPLALYPPAPHVRRRSVARLSEHTGGLGAPHAVGLEAPPRVVSHSGGERIGMRDGGESRTLPRRSDPHPPIGSLVFIREKSWGLLLSTFIIYVLLGHGPQTARAVVGRLYIA